MIAQICFLCDGLHGWLWVAVAGPDRMGQLHPAFVVPEICCILAGSACILAKKEYNKAHMITADRHNCTDRGR